MGRKLNYKYDKVGNLKEKVVGDERRTLFTYDKNGNLTEKVNPLNQKESFTYNVMNQVSKYTNSAGNITNFTYDKRMQLIKVSSPLKGEINYSYDGSGNLIKEFDSSVRTKEYTYDLNERLIKATYGGNNIARSVSADKREMSYKYDSVGNIVSKTDGNGNTTSYKYNLLGQMTEEKNPLGKKIGYKYDKAANLKQVVKPSGKKISYDYNKLDAVVKKEYQDESEGKVLYGYDKDGRLISMKDKTGESLYEYDEDGVITGVKQGDGSLIKYEYDKFGNVTSLIYPDKRKVEYKYDELDRLIEVKDLSGRKVKYEYDINSNMIKSTRDDNSKTQLEYNEENRIVSLTNTLSSGKKISSYKYTYDKNGYISSEVIKAGGKTTRNNYAYNSSGELLSVYTNDSGVKKSEIYAYDKAGNKISVIRTENGFNKKINYKYNKDNALVSDSEGNSYIYDKDGNRIKKLKDGEEVLKYNYDTESRLIAVKDKKGLLFAALYDGNNNRIFTANRTEKKTKYKLYKKAPRTSVQGKEVSLFWKGFTTSLVSGFNVSSSTTGKVWNESWDDIEIAYNKRLAKEKAGRQGVVLESIKKEELEVPKSIEENKASYKTKSDIPLIPSGIKEDTNTYYEIKNYVNDINRKHTQVLAAYDENGKYTESFDYGKNRLNYHTQDKSYAYQYDGRGSVSSITNKEEVVQRYNYSSYGNTLEKSKIDNPYKYNAEYIDNATGMQYLRARYYDNSSVNSNTFITRDTYAGDISNPQSQNRYNYTKSNPVNFIDPSGNFFEKVWDGIKSVGNSVINTTKNIGQTVYNHLPKPIQKAVDYGYNKVRPYINVAKNAVKKAVEVVDNFVYNTSSKNIQKKKEVYKEKTEYERALESGKSVYNWGASKLREARNIAKSWSEALEKTVNNFCVTNKNVEKQKPQNYKKNLYQNSLISSIINSSSSFLKEMMKSKGIQDTAAIVVDKTGKFIVQNYNNMMFSVGKVSVIGGVGNMLFDHFYNQNKKQIDDGIHGMGSFMGNFTLPTFMPINDKIKKCIDVLDP